MAHKKANLTQKTCPVGQRLFSWRKKWKMDWEQVIFCSEKCPTYKNKKRLTPKEKIQPTHLYRLNLIFILLFLTTIDV